MAEKAVVVLSGGQDSTTCLYHAKELGYEIHAVTFNYGQRHTRELESACRIAALAQVANHELIHLSPRTLTGTSPLISDSKLEQYKDHKSLPGGLEKTFVPMRNQLFLTIAANRAYNLGANVMFTGVCQEDYGGYPDCRRDFINAFALASSIGTFNGEAGAPDGLEIITPLMYMTKAESIGFALGIEGCYEALAFTHTSYDGQYPPIGKDHATLLREKGFIEAGVPDPLVVRAWYEGEMDLPDTPNYSTKTDFHPLVQLITDFLDRRNGLHP